ncbi:MAG: hypothetical protein GY838_01825 [bacterium]|nr:hypothetical protein [bacterium]
MTNLKRYGTCLLMAALLLLPGAAAADDDPPSVVIMNGDEQVTITIDGSELSVVTDDDGDTSIHLVDLAVMGDMLGDSLEGLDEMLAELQDLQLDFHLGADNNLQFSFDEETWDLDMDGMMEQVAEALEEGFGAMDSEDWTDVRERDRSTDELRDELRELKAEMRELRRQLQEQRDDG